MFDWGRFVGLDVEKPVVPEHVQTAAAERGLFEKSEFHISVLVARNLRLAREAAAKHGKVEILRAIEEAFKKYEWEYEPTNKYFVHERAYSKEDLADEGYAADIPPHARHSIVQKVVLPDLGSFYTELNRALGASLPLPVPHITLFAWSDYEPFKTHGIGINSEAQFRQFTKSGPLQEMVLRKNESGGI